MVVAELAASQFAELPDGWISSTLGELFEIKQGKALSQRARSGNGAAPFLRTANVLWGRLELETLDEMDFTPDQRTALELRPGDLLVCEGGEIGRTAMWNGELEGCFYQNHVHRLRRRSSQVDPGFVMYWMQAAHLLLGRYRGTGNKTTIPNLSKGRLAAFEIPLPSLPEQQAIARILDAVQEAIEATERVISAVTQLKKSLMKHIFTYGVVPVSEAEYAELQETEMGPIPAHWQIQTLGSLAEAFSYGTSERCDFSGAGYPVLGIPNVIRGRVNSAALKFTAARTVEHLRYWLRVGDLLFVRTNGQRDYIGRCATYAGEPAETLFASYLVRGRFSLHVVDPQFVAAWLGTPEGREATISLAAPAAGGRFNLSASSIKAIRVPVPPLSEQAAAASVFEAADRKLWAEESRLTSLRQLFNSLLEQLMTGKLRVPPAMIEPTNGEAH